LHLLSKGPVMLGMRSRPYPTSVALASLLPRGPGKDMGVAAARDEVHQRLARRAKHVGNGLALWRSTRARAVRADAVRQRGLPPRHARNHPLLADPAGRISSNTPRAAPQRPRAQKARPSESYSSRAPQRARAEQRHRVSDQHTYYMSYYSSIGGIFLTEGFQTTIRLPKAPPGGHCPLRRFLYRSAGI
jgi:hypothetical protein